MLLLFAVAQAASSVPTGKIDLTTHQSCETTPSDDDVIVCGRRRDDQSRYRIPPTAMRGSNMPKAAWRLGNGVGLAAETEQVDIGGAPSNRIMIRFKFPF